MTKVQQDGTMISTKTETEGIDTLNENNNVEVFGYDMDGDKISHVFELDINVSHFFDVVYISKNHNREKVRNELLKEIFELRKHKNSMKQIGSSLLKLIGTERTIVKEAKEFISGGFAIVMMIDVKSKKVNDISLITPKDLSFFRSQDYSILEPDFRIDENYCNDRNSLNDEEKMFLYLLSQICKTFPYSEAIVSNQQLFDSMNNNPPTDIKWIAKTLGKLYRYGLIKFEYLEGLRHRLPIRTLWVIDETTNMLMDALNLSTQHYPIKNSK